MSHPSKGEASEGSVSNNRHPPAKLGLESCISSRIATVIHIQNYRQRNHNWYNEPFAVSQNNNSDWDMHGLIFETSIWLLAGSTRLRISCCRVCKQTTRNASSWGVSTTSYGVRDGGTHRQLWSRRASRQLAASAAYHKVSSAFAHYYNQVFRRSTSTEHPTLPKRIWWCKRSMGRGLLWETILMNVGLIKPAPKVIDHDQGEHQKHLHNIEDIANACALHIARTRMNNYFAHRSRVNC